MANVWAYKEGDRIDYTPTADVAAGTVVNQNGLLGVATEPIAANRLGSLAISGIFEAAKPTNLAINAGEKVYWYSEGGVVNKTDTNPYFGRAVETVSAATPRVKVLLIPN